MMTLTMTQVKQNVKHWCAMTTLVTGMAIGNIASAIATDISISYAVSDGEFSAIVQGTTLAEVEHFMFDGTVIDEFVFSEATDIEEFDNGFTLWVDLLEGMTGGVFGVMVDGQVTAVAIPAELLGTETAALRKKGSRQSCYASFSLYGHEADDVYIGSVRGGYRKSGKRCFRKAKKYAVNRLGIHQFDSLTRSEVCEYKRRENKSRLPIYISSEPDDGASRTGYAKSKLHVSGCRR